MKSLMNNVKSTVHGANWTDGRLDDSTIELTVEATFAALTGVALNTGVSLDDGGAPRSEHVFHDAMVKYYEQGGFLTDEELDEAIPRLAAVERITGLMPKQFMLFNREVRSTLDQMVRWRESRKNG